MGLSVFALPDLGPGLQHFYALNIFPLHNEGGGFHVDFAKQRQPDSEAPEMLQDSSRAVGGIEGFGKLLKSWPDKEPQTLYVQMEYSLDGKRVRPKRPHGQSYPADEDVFVETSVVWGNSNEESSLQRVSHTFLDDGEKWTLTLSGKVSMDRISFEMFERVEEELWGQAKPLLDFLP